MALTRPVASCSIGAQTDYAQQSTTGNVFTSEDPAQDADISCFVSLPWTWVEGIRPRGRGVAVAGHGTGDTVDIVVRDVNVSPYCGWVAR